MLLRQPISIEQARQMSPIVLAFVGDAVYTLYVRQCLVLEADYRASELNLRSSKCVSAHGQSELLARMESRLTQAEHDIFLRGRNAKKPTRSKNASVAEYNRSTGFEAVIGYLYLTGQADRILELVGEEA